MLKAGMIIAEPVSYTHLDVYKRQVEICDRKEAIAYAIHHGEPGDIIVLAGKGHEDYQEIQGKKYPMDERVLIAEILEEDKERENA